jgi:hypothetical protein
MIPRKRRRDQNHAQQDKEKWKSEFDEEAQGNGAKIGDGKWERQATGRKK